MPTMEGHIVNLINLNCTVDHHQQKNGFGSAEFRAYSAHLAIGPGKSLKTACLIVKC